MAVKILQMKGKNVQVPFKNGYYELTQPLNDSFEKGILRVAYTGKNRNNTFISKQTFEDAIPTIYNCPIVANYSREDDEIGSHDSELVEKDEGYVFVNITQPVGVIPESAKYWWENIEEDDGKIHEYFCIEVILWKRQECYDKIKRNGVTDESMEIAVNNGEWVDGCYHINSMTFLAFCLLGTAEPCFESACVEVFDKTSDNQEFERQFTQMIDELKSYSKIQSKGENQMDKFAEVLSKYGLTEDELRQAGFEFDESTDIEAVKNYCIEYSKISEDDDEESNEEKFEKKADDESDDEGDTGSNDTEQTEEDDDNSSDEVEADDESNDDANDNPADNEDGNDADNGDNGEGEQNFSLTLNDFIDEIYNAVRQKETITDEYGWEYSRYLYHDILENEVIVIDRLDNWHLFGVPYSMDGDIVKLAWEDKKRKKVSYEDFDGEAAADSKIEEFIADFALFMNKKVEEIKEKYESVKKSQLKNDLEKVFEKFNAQLDGNDEYEEYKDEVLEKLNQSPENAENHCYAIVGKLNMNYSLSSKKTDTKKAIRLGVDGSLHSDKKKNKPYGGIFEED